MRRFADISVSKEFIKDYESAPKEIQGKVDHKINLWAVTGELTPSAQAHKAYWHDYWIIYVNLGNAGWRVLAQFEEDIMILSRLVDHEDMKDILRPCS